MADTQMQELPLNQIRVREGFNPRKYFDEQGMESLVRSVEKEGVVQPITVRPDPSGEGYEVVAGERRYRASEKVGLNSIPAVIRELDDAQAMAIALLENQEREDISPAEEARVAQRAVSCSDGDKDEACRLLGWPRKRLDSRLALLHAAEPVLQALERREIKIGHAELLATVPEETQAGTLRQIVEKGITVEALKGKLGEFTRELAHARFDTRGCIGCPFNSSTQASLFEAHVGEGRCSNYPCWNEKTEAYIETKRQEAAEEYPVVFLDRERDESMRTPLLRDGPKGVGAAQYEACQSCKYHGALVSTEPGKAGRVTEGVCFNVTCNAEKVAEARAAEKTEDDEKAADSGAPSKQATGGANGSGGAAKSADKASAKQNAGSPKRVVEAIQAFLRTQAGVLAHERDDLQQALALYGAFSLTSGWSDQGGDVDEARTVIGAGQVVMGADLFKKVLDADAATRTKALALLARGVFKKQDFQYGESWLKNAKSVLAYESLDLSQHFKLDETFLRKHTKKGMQALLTEAGFARWYDEQHGKGHFHKLMGQKVDVIVSKVFNAGFDFTGFVPKAVYDEAGYKPPKEE